jgi:5'-3' exonuclease
VLFDTNNFKTIIVDYFKNKLENIQDTIIMPKLILYNYVFLCFIFGNDFLPKLVGFDLNNSNIEYVLDTYIHQYCIIKKHIIDEDGKINTYPLRQFFLTLYGNEQDRLHKYFKNIYYKLKDKTEINHDENKSIYLGFQDNNILHNWMDTYYKYYFNIININKNFQLINNLCSNYIEGLQWNITYYIYSCPSYKWYYKYPAAPCLRELCKFTKDRIYYPNFEQGNYTPLEQLSLVLPIQSKKLLPLGYQKMMIIEPLNKWYPNDFKLDTLFHMYVYECHPRLMNINDIEIINIYKELEKKQKLSSFDKLRNIIGKMIIF